MGYITLRVMRVADVLKLCGELGCKDVCSKVLPEVGNTIISGMICVPLVDQ